jgi:hypothetical protein
MIAAASVGPWAGAEETQRRVLAAVDAFSKGRYRDDVTTVVLAIPPGAHAEDRFEDVAGISARPAEADRDG